MIKITFFETKMENTYQYGLDWTKYPDDFRANNTVYHHPGTQGDPYFCTFSDESISCLDMAYLMTTTEDYDPFYYLKEEMDQFIEDALS